MEAGTPTSSHDLRWSELSKGGLSSQALLARWGAADCCEPCFKALLRAAGTAALGQQQWDRQDREVLEEGAPLDPFLADLLARWEKEEAAIRLDEAQPAVGPRLIAVERPDRAGAQCVT